MFDVCKQIIKLVILVCMNKKLNLQLVGTKIYCTEYYRIE